MNFIGSKTQKNLKKALQGEALAHLKYQFYRSQLSKTSKDLAKHLDEIIHNEKEHGKIWFKLLNNDKIPNDQINILNAIDGEIYEHISMYPKFAEEAYEEGFDHIGKLFEGVATIEGQHAEEFDEMLKWLSSKKLFKDDEEWGWLCLNCGHIHYGKEAPKNCPICNHPQIYFVRD